MAAAGLGLWLRGARDPADIPRALAAARMKLHDRASDWLGLTERGIVRAAMRRRPGDLWPRARGHVVLAFPGSAEPDKAYVEPGGSFSPSVGSFGIAVWILGAAGEVVATSDTLPPAAVRQRFRHQPTGPPTLETESGSYRLAITGVRPGRWRLRLQPVGGSTLMLALRGVGPAGGPLTSIARDDRGLILNGRWHVGADGALALEHAGAETGDAAGSWMRSGAPQLPVLDAAGWAQARIRVPPDGLALDIADRQAAPASAPLQDLPTHAGTRLTVPPDDRHQPALDAGVAHLMMGLVGRETRPGEPTTYPLAWLRDGAAVIVALVRAGRLDAARQLVGSLAQADFFGGFGAEGDAPGLAIWAIEEVLRGIGDPALDRALWPDVQRKADLILSFMSARADVRVAFTGPLVPLARQPLGVGAGGDTALAARPAADGLIIGRMDWHFPAMYVTAASYRGLRDAAALGRRVGQAGPAARWDEAAGILRDAWNRHLATADADDERTLINGLSPSFVATDLAAYRRRLDGDWEATRRADGGYRERPLWTYFEAAKAGQRLLAGQPERARRTIGWLWDHSPAPGLYTLWEGRGEENSFGRWDQVRGWVDPPDVSPHYWSQAEMLLAQLALFAVAVPQDEGSALVVAAGLPPGWFAGELSATDVVTRLGPVSWHWQAPVLTVGARDCPARLEIGAAVPAEAEIRFRGDPSCAPAIVRQPKDP